MIVKLIGQLLLATSVVNILPVDASALEWRAGVGSGEMPSVVSATSWFATLPLAADRVRPPTKIDLDSYGVVTSARSAIVIDSESGAVLFEKHPDDVRAIGSITKLMSALVFLETSPDLASTVTLVTDDYVGGGRVYLRFDDEVMLRDVLRASLIGSDNTATTALARLAGMTQEDFVARMNAKALELGMQSTSYADPSGVDAGNVSTARDLAKLLGAAQANGIMADIMSRATAVVTQGSGYSVTVESTNELLGGMLDSGAYDIKAGKTGFIPQAGYCFATTVARGDAAVRIVVLGAASKSDRFSDAKGLAAWAFKTYSWQ